MLLNTRHIAIIASISFLASALPFNTPRQIVPRQKNYSVINVDGGSSNGAQPTTVVKLTKTVEVANPGPTVTQAVTTVLSVALTPTPSCSTSESTTSVPSSTITSAAVVSSSVPIETPKPIFITVTASNDDGPTEYYDNGLWHTSYRVKTFEAAVATVVPSASVSSISSSAVAPMLETSAPSFDETSFQQYA
jgi:hypothetical protein